MKFPPWTKSLPDRPPTGQTLTRNAHVCRSIFFLNFSSFFFFTSLFSLSGIALRLTIVPWALRPVGPPKIAPFGRPEKAKRAIWVVHGLKPRPQFNEMIPESEKKSEIWGWRRKKKILDPRPFLGRHPSVPAHLWIFFFVLVFLFSPMFFFFLSRLSFFKIFPACRFFFCPVCFFLFVPNAFLLHPNSSSLLLSRSRFFLSQDPPCAPRRAVCSTQGRVLHTQKQKTVSQTWLKKKNGRSKKVEVACTVLSSKIEGLCERHHSTFDWEKQGSG